MVYESKYVAPRRVATALRQRLDKHFAPDGEYPVNRIHSVYFDTSRGDAFAEADNGDFYKTKVRVRWYESAGAGDGRAGPAFVECKSKMGPRRHKLRVKLDDVRTDLPLHHPAWLTLPRLLLQQGAEIPPGLLQPTLHISYQRHRFLEPTDDLRIALDSDIRALRVHPRFARAQAIVRRPAPWMVFEAKGATRHLPASLRFVKSYGARRMAFSKYALWNDVL